MKVIAVLGARGMTGQAIQRFAAKDDRDDRSWVFVARDDVDLVNEDALVEFLVSHKVTQVINIAAVVGGITFNITHPLSTLDTNLRLATSVLSACHRAGIQKAVSVLSTCIFPTKHEKAFHEGHIFDGEPHETNAGYAYAKRTLLSLSQAYAKQCGREYVCLVPPNLYGPHDKFDKERAHVIGALVRKFYQAEQATGKGRKVSVYGSGAARRQFMHCDDLAQLLVWALEEYHDALEPLIVGPDDDVSIKELVETLAQNFADDIVVEWDITKPDGQLQKKAINLKMRRLLPSWKSMSLPDGLADTAKWYRSVQVSNQKDLTFPGQVRPRSTFPGQVRPWSTFPLCSNNLPSGDIEAAVDLLRSGEMLSMGAQTEAFEKEYAEFMGVPESLFVNSGSSANLLAVVAAMHPERSRRLRRGDKVAVPSLCWSTTVAPLITQGLVPVFVDVDPSTLQMDLDNVEELLKKDSDVKALMIVHVLGACPNMDDLMSLVRGHDLILIEDACEAMGNTWKGRRLGTFGDFGTFSTFYSHHMTSIEGGFVLANDLEDRLRLRAMRAHGWIRHLPPATQEAMKTKHPDIDPRFLFVDVGFNMRPLDLCACIGRRQLQRLEASNDNRRHNYQAIYDRLCEHPQVSLPAPSDEIAFLALPLIFDKDLDLKTIQESLESMGVQTRPLISGNFVRQPMMKTWELEYTDPLAFPGAEYIHHHGIYIGLHGDRWSESYCDELAHRILTSLK